MTDPANEEEVANILFQRYKSDEGNGQQNLDVITERRKSYRPSTPTHIDELEKKWFFSSVQCDLDTLKRLAEKDYELVNRRDFATGFAAIHWAAKKGRTDVVTWLISEQNADINIRTYGGYSPLHLATMHNRKCLINRLISDFDADINVRDYSGRMPRHYLKMETPSLAMLSHTYDVKAVTTLAVRAEPQYMRHSLPNSYSMESIVDLQEGAKKKKKGLSLSASFKGKRKLLVIKRGHHEHNGSDDNSPPPLSQKSKWRKSLSVPDIAISGPFVKFEQDI